MAGNFPEAAWGHTAEFGMKYDETNKVWSLTKVLPVGEYEYKFLGNADGWKTDEFNTLSKDGNSVVIVSGLEDITKSIRIGSTIDLPDTLRYVYVSGGETTKEVTYKLADEDAGYANKVSIEADTLTLANDFPEDVEAFELIATDSEDNTATVTVEVVGYPNEDKNVKSPVVNDNEVTFNLYGPKYTAAHVVGTLPEAEWDINDNFKMTYDRETAYWSLTKTVPAGKWEYKYIINEDKDNGWIQDPLNKSDDGGNSIFYVSGLGNGEKKK